MAYDALRERVVLFGGSSESEGPLGDTWEWDGAVWTRIAPPRAPAPRAAHVMAFDAARGRVTLYGGCNDNVETFRDTWTWDGATWEQVATTGPRVSTSCDHAMVYDEAGRRLVLLIENRHRYEDPEGVQTWQWNGARWEELAADSAPPATYHYAAAYQGQREHIVLFTNETWTSDGAAWTRRTTGRAPRSHNDHEMVWDHTRARVVLFGGARVVAGGDEPRFLALGETWEWDGATWTRQRTATAPPARYLHAMAYDVARGRLVLFGGHTGRFVLADTWVYR